MFRKLKNKSLARQKRSELQFKKRSIILSNYLQSSYTSTNLDSQVIPDQIIDNIISYLPFHDLNNFSAINKATYNYVQHQQVKLWQSYLELIEIFDRKEYTKLKRQHAHLNERDFYTRNKEVISSLEEKKFNALYIYPNLVTAEETPKFHMIYNPRLYKLQFIFIYKSLYPLYRQLISSNLQFNNTLFIKQYNNPIHQSILLNSFLKFSKFQLYQLNSKDYNLNLQNLQSVIEFFENACLREIEIGYDNKDFKSKVNYYTNVLLNLNDNLINNNLVNFFLQKLTLNDLIIDNADSYFVLTENENMYKIDKPKLEKYFGNLAKLLNNQIEIIDEIFKDDKIQLILKIFEEIIQNYILEFVNFLMQKARNLTIINESIMFSDNKTLVSSGNLSIILFPYIYSSLITMVRKEVKMSINGGKSFKENLINLMNLYLESLINEYLSEELSFFVKVAEFNVHLWEEKTKLEESQLEQDILKNVKSNTDVNNKNSSFLKLDLITGFKNILKPINVSFANHSESEINPVEPIGGTATQEDKKIMTEFEAQLAIMNTKLVRIKSFFSLDLSMNIMNNARAGIQRISLFIQEINLLIELNDVVLQLDYNKNILKSCKKRIEDIFIKIIDIIGEQHVKKGFAKAIERLKDYNPDESGTSNISSTTLDSELNVQPLMVFAELVNIGDLIQNLIEVFYTEELIHKKIINKTQDFLSKVLQSKKKFELMLDDSVANGLNIGIDALINKVQYIYDHYQNASDFNPDPLDRHIKVGAVTTCARKTVDLLSNHVKLLIGSAEKSTVDVFQQEVSQRFFALIVKNLKTLKINTIGALTLISDFNYYYDFIVTLKQRQILPYFIGLKTVGQIYLIDGSDAKLIGKTISDLNRFNGIFQQEEIYELVQCRADWLKVKREVEKEMFGIFECIIM